jgi:two-component system sensor histidine kinase CpxA
MRLRGSLSFKLLFWFFLNLVVVGGFLFFSFDLDFRVGPDSPVFGKNQNRMPILGFNLVRDLTDTPRDQWDKLLKQYSNLYKVELALYDPKSDHQAGQRMTVPLAVRVRMADTFAPPPMPPDHQCGGAAGNDGSKGFGADAQGECPHCKSGQCGSRPPENRRPFFKMKTSGPTHYWAAARLPGVRDPGKTGLDLILLARSDSITGNGLFMDPTPWITMGLLLVALSVLLWIPMLRHITAPLREMTRATERIAGGRFDVKIHVNREDEIGRLGAAINDMSDRLSNMIFGQKRFLGDAAHELASPLARMQLGVGILEESVDDANRGRVAELKEEIQQMSDLVNGLLSFSRSDAVSGRVKLGEVNLFQVLARVVDREIPDQSMDVVMEVPEDLNVRADPELAQRIFANLVRNAVRYAGHAGPIEIRAERGNGIARVVVGDHGPGVPPEKLALVFEPFYRVEQSRVRESGGVGLGLAIVQTAVNACQGAVRAENRPEGGFVVTVELPLA